MKLKIQRLGGMLPALRPTVTHELAALPSAQQQALKDWMAQAGRVSKAAHAEAMNYVFTLESAGDEGANEKSGTPVKVSAAYADVPEALRELLPAAASVRGTSGKK
jgi:hypothetical protein